MPNFFDEWQTPGRCKYQESKQYVVSGLFLQLIDLPPNPPIAYLVTQTLWTLTSPCIEESTYLALNLCLVGFFWTLPAFPTEIGI